MLGKTAIITGASKGIGKAVAELFAEEGASVVLTARGKHELNETVAGIKAAGNNAIGIVSDANSAEGCKNVFATAIKEFGQVDIVVNNAGYGDMSSIEETTDEHFLEVVNINLVSTFRYCREAVQHFMPRGEGVIINVSSVNGERPICGVAYTATKGAVNTLTKNIAIRFAGTRIRCNALSPGVTETSMAEAWASGNLPGGSLMMEHAEKYANLSLPPTKPIDQAYAALYLASDNSRAVTGQVLQVCNGAFL
ncbi:SDR family NAD(P)-dependent oxidoreductase [Metabacillus arenae]|uniref:SDR family NAD(P)-dependent oxidoreductase n=1 Tax=Metabacillus arenae TaxID=2771434 RepID=UPI001CD10278|nr:SDR family oxidoreductase [Metabacillus arenae]